MANIFSKKLLPDFLLGTGGSKKLWKSIFISKSTKYKLKIANFQKVSVDEHCQPENLGSFLPRKFFFFSCTQYYSKCTNTPRIPATNTRKKKFSLRSHELFEKKTEKNLGKEIAKMQPKKAKKVGLKTNNSIISFLFVSSIRLHCYTIQLTGTQMIWIKRQLTLWKKASLN